MRPFINKLTAATVALASVAAYSSAQSPLYIPPAMSGAVFNLTVKASTTQFFKGINTPTYGVNGPLLGPTLVLRKNDIVTLNVTNTLNTSTTMHWHGLHIPAKCDGGPHQIILPGTTWSPSFKVMNDAGTYWYHPHGENKTDIQVSKGIAGMILIKDSFEDKLVLPRSYGVDDFPVIIQTKAFDVLYQVAISTPLDTVLFVNGTRNPYINAPAQYVRLRLLNASSERTYNLGLSDSIAFYQIASDNGLLATPVKLNRLRISNGERAEILIDLSKLKGKTLYLKNFGTELPNGILGSKQVGYGSLQILDYKLNNLNGADYTILQINVIGQTATPVLSMPSKLADIKPYLATEAMVKRTFAFAPEISTTGDSVNGSFTINGHHYSMDTVNTRVNLNDIEIWTLKNNTLIAHPFHIHDTYFYILDINGDSVPPNERGKKDVVLVMPKQSVRFITKFEDYTDSVPYMYHCHILHHEDDGMMGSFVVSNKAGIANLGQRNTIGVYPNPVSGDYANIVFTQIPDQKPIYSISDIFGQNILSGIGRIENSELKINVSKLNRGMFFITVFAGSQSYSSKIIKD
jgi:blue copper oxidase